MKHCWIYSIFHLLLHHPLQASDNFFFFPSSQPVLPSTTSLPSYLALKLTSTYFHCLLLFFRLNWRLWEKKEEEEEEEDQVQGSQAERATNPSKYQAVLLAAWQASLLRQQHSSYWTRWLGLRLAHGGRKKKNKWPYFLCDKTWERERERKVSSRFPWATCALLKLTGLFLPSHQIESLSPRERKTPSVIERIAVISDSRISCWLWRCLLQSPRWERFLFCFSSVCPCLLLGHVTRGSEAGQLVPLASAHPASSRIKSPRRWKPAATTVSGAKADRPGESVGGCPWRPQKT